MSAKVLSGETMSESEGGSSPRLPRASHPFFEGFRAGVEGFRIVGQHEIPTQHPQGHTDEGAEWFRGCVTALQQIEATFRGSPPNPTPKHPSKSRNALADQNPQLCRRTHNSNEAHPISGN